MGVLYGTGEEFDSSWSRQEAITFTIGMGQLIDGWEKGLMDVPVGSRIILDLPPDLPTATRTTAAAGRPATCGSWWTCSARRDSDVKKRRDSKESRPYPLNGVYAGLGCSETFCR